MKYLLLILFSSVCFAQEYFISIVDHTDDQMEIQIEHNGCTDKYLVNKDIKDVQKLAKQIVLNLKTKYEKK